eukprot:GHVS01003810.1.p1 GENE.GHVS01003810.1~~GHVS01003810.1.p1  ORF type:complete len:214 (+),score=63.96 GHVS01003810.1:92-643(+)
MSVLSDLCPTNDLFTPITYYVLCQGCCSANRSCGKSNGVPKEEDLFDESSPAEAAKKQSDLSVKPKKVIINKSSLVIEIKPNSTETDLENVLQLVKKININGVSWGEASKKVPVAFGLYKLQVSCTIIDDLVNTEDITDAIEGLGLTKENAEQRIKRKDAGEEEEEDNNCLVQSADIVSFNKL